MIFGNGLLFLILGAGLLFSHEETPFYIPQIMILLGTFFLGVAYWTRKGGKRSPVNPIAEAAVYLAYGQKRQAIEVLEKGLANDPQRSDIATKLAELKR